MAYPTTLVFQVTTPLLGCQPIASTSTTKQHPFGTIVRATETTLFGECEFLYVKGVASVAAGDLLFYDDYAGTTVRAVDDGTHATGPCGIAMAAITASLYGWVQISGSGTILYAGTATQDLQAYLTATAGAVSSSIIDAGDAVAGMVFKTAVGTPATAFTTVQCNRPCVAVQD